MRRLSSKQVSTIKVVLFFLLLTPSLVAGARVLMGDIAEPADYITHVSGDNTLRLLVLTLLITPLAAVSGWHWLIKLRRMIGLYVFYYASLHFLAYLLLDLQLDFGTLVEDILERKYITLGFIALLLLLAMAVTSNDWSIKKMGVRRWMKLHRLIYIIAPLGIAHFWWQIKNEAIAQPLMYAIVVAALLALRYPPLASKIRRK